MAEDANRPKTEVAKSRVTQRAICEGLWTAGDSRTENPWAMRQEEKSL